MHTSPDIATAWCSGVVACAGRDVTVHAAPTARSTGTHASAY
ncbi:Uncharacterised protein [Mycobacteroides abscessus subsp. abscessus]|nr:Uncharacterised protein [Mycobacteroides abscessus subsp. abscessus]